MYQQEIMSTTNGTTKRINVTFLKTGMETVSPQDAGLILEDQAKEVKLDQVPWEAYPYRPEAVVRIGWTQQEILLRFDVTEEDVKALFTEDNSPVHRDSCVEFFIAPGDGTYFNFEFNPRGVAYAARGRRRENSKPLSIEEVALIRRFSSLEGKPLPPQGCSGSWTLTIVIPLTLFSGTSLEQPGGKSFRANFYKCGDETIQPHFITWNHVGTKEPDFHRPEYFGCLDFSGTEEKGNADA